MVTLLLADILTLDLVKGYYEKLKDQNIGKTIDSFAEVTADGDKKVDPIGAYLILNRAVSFERLLRYEGQGIDDIVADFGFDYDEVDGYVDGLDGVSHDTKPNYERGFQIGKTLADASL